MPRNPFLRTASCVLFPLLAASAPLRAAERWQFREKTLENGLRVVVHEDHSCPIAAVQVWYHVGSKNEDPERQGFAHMFEHMMFRGTDRLGPEDHFKYIRGVGGRCNAYTSFDQTVYVQTVPSNQLDLVFWLEAERMTSLKVDREGFETERRVVEEERRLGLNRPYGTVPERVLERVFTVHPYRWMTIGKIEHLRAATVEELLRFWETYYVPNNAVLVVVGDVDADEVFEKAERYFGWIPRCPDPPRVTQREPEWTEPKEIELTEERGPMPLAAVAWRTVPAASDDALPLQMLGWILGGGESSRLWRRVVDEEGLAPMVVSLAMSLEDDGFLAAGAMALPFADLDRLLEVIEDEVAKIRESGPTEEEVEKARVHFRREMVDGARTVESKARWIGEAVLFHGSPDWVNERLERLETVGAEDIVRVARSYLVDRRMVRLKVKPTVGGMVRSLVGGLGGAKGAAEEPEEGEAGGGAGSGAEGAEGGGATPRPKSPKAFAKRPDGYPETPPIAPPLGARIDIDTVERTLDNGLRVVVLENHELPAVSVRLGSRYGAFAESKPGAAQFACQMITRGTRLRDAKALAEITEGNAITLGAGASIDSLSVTGRATSDRFRLLMQLLAEVVRFPTFPEDEFAEEKQRTLAGLRIAEKQPEQIAERAFRRALFGEFFYGRSARGTSAEVQRLEPADCRTFWKAAVRPEQCILYVAGDVDPDKAFELAEALFSDWEAEGAPPALAMPKLPPARPTKILLVDVPGAVQSQIRVGQLGITRADERWPAALVLTQVFGGSFESRLNETIRVKRGLTYGARGGLASGRFAGRFYVSTFSKTATTAEAVRAIFDEIRRLREEAPTDHELDQAVSYLVGSYPARYETPEAVIGELFSLELDGLSRDWPTKTLEAVREVTAGDVQALARDLVDPDRQVVVVVGDADRVGEELEGIAGVEVVDESLEPKTSR